MKAQVKIEAPKSGDDFRNLTPFFSEVARRLNLPMEVKPRGVVTTSGEKILIDLTECTYHLNVAVNGAPGRIAICAFGAPEPIPE